MQTANTVTFGRRGVSNAAVSPVRQSIGPREPDIKPELPAGRSSTGLTKLLECAFLWVPNEQSPGFGAVCLALARQAVLPFILIVGPFIAYMIAFGGFPWKSLLPGTTPTSQAFILLAYIFGCLALVQELSRYAFIRRASDPTRSALLFGAVVMACSVIVHRDSPYTLAWMMAAQVGASVAMLCTRRYWSQRLLIVAAIVVCQTAVTFTMPRFDPHHAPSTAAIRRIETPAAQSAPANTGETNTSTAESPHVGGMEAWAKLYPDAAVKTNDTQDLLGLTSWRVQYDTNATADQVASFYDGVASQYGFKADKAFLGVHQYSRANLSDSFQYQIYPTDTGLAVFFTARVFEQK